MGSTDHYSILVSDGEDEGKYVGREDIHGVYDGPFDEDDSLEIEGVDDGVDDHDQVKGSQMGLSKLLIDPVGWTLKYTLVSP